MSTEREKLEKDQARLWELLELKSKDSEVENEIHELLFEIKTGYSDLIDQQEQPEDSYAFLKFCVRYVDIDPNKTYINLEYDLGDVWRKVADRDDFQALLEEDLLTAIEEKKIGNVFQVQQIANDFTKKENFAKARTYFQVIKEHINNPTAWDNWAHCCAAENDFAGAIDVITSGLENYPDSQVLACNRGFYLAKNKKHNDALNALQAFIDRVETTKYKYDRHYIYAVKLKASIYRELNMPLQALIEYSRLSTAGQCDRDFVKENSELMIPHVEALTYG